MSEVIENKTESVLPKIKALWGQKAGMTQIFGAVGQIIPVTVVLVPPASVTEILTPAKHGYSAVRVAFGAVREKSLNKPRLGILKKVAAPLSRWIREIRVDNTEGYAVGQLFKADVFSPGDYVDVAGTSKGRGFAGAMKRHNFRGGPSTHGQSDRARAPGSSGSNTYPGRVFKGKKFPGHFGLESTTVQHLEVVGIRPEQNLLLVKGALPGPTHSLVYIRQTKKHVKVKTAPVIDPKAAKKAAAKANAAATSKAKAAK
jgi:large subunit ribosomal protein L3